MGPLTYGARMRATRTGLHQDRGKDYWEVMMPAFGRAMAELVLELKTSGAAPKNICGTHGHLLAMCMDQGDMDIINAADPNWLLVAEELARVVGNALWEGPLKLAMRMLYFKNVDKRLDDLANLDYLETDVESFMDLARQGAESMTATSYTRCWRQNSTTCGRRTSRTIWRPRTTSGNSATARDLRPPL